MDHLCVNCNEELIVSIANGKRSTYCQGCGREDETPAPRRSLAPVIPITRAEILKKINAAATEQKKPKQIKQHRDKQDYTKARRMR